ncbi:MAG: hypothetical protein MSH55_08155 [Enorma sp.]|uniref:hypothetical protein n=1 Tax=Enorma sp. TaxID=1920692 RepID=UPI00258A2978|nr:hypothetical protein [Enorma sp.]MCI7775729.1 hypothetical protein [Enorma sp.]
MEAPAIVAHDVSYRSGAYRSFEFSSFKVSPGEVCVLLSTDHAPARDVLLAVIGLVKPTSGSLVVCGVELAGGAPASGLAALRRAFAPRERLPRAQVGLGVFERVAEVSGAWTVEEAVAREARLRAHRGGAARVRDAAGTNGSSRAGYAADLAAGVAEHTAAFSPECEPAADATGKRDAKQSPFGAGSRASDVLPFLAALGLATASEQEIDRLNPAQRARFSAVLALAGAPRVAVIDLTDPFVTGLSAADASMLVEDVRSVAVRMGTAVLIATSEPACACAAEAFGCSACALDIPAAEALDAMRASGHPSKPASAVSACEADAAPDSLAPKREVMA